MNGLPPGRADEGPEQRVRFERLGLEFRMELAGQGPGMIGQFADFHVDPVGSLAGDAQPRRGQDRFVFPVELEAVPVALADLARAIGALRKAALGQQAVVGAQAHGPAQLIAPLQLPQLVDDAVRRGGIEFAGIRALQPADVAREFDDHGLHTQADAEARRLSLARQARAPGLLRGPHGQSGC